MQKLMNINLLPLLASPHVGLCEGKEEEKEVQDN